MRAAIKIETKCKNKFKLAFDEKWYVNLEDFIINFSIITKIFIEIFSVIDKNIKWVIKKMGEKKNEFKFKCIKCGIKGNLDEKECFPFPLKCIWCYLK